MAALRALARDRPLELLLVHGRSALDAHRLGLLVQLISRAPARGAPVGAQSAAAPRGHVLLGKPGRVPGLTVAGSLLVDGAGRDLLSLVLGRAALEQRVLDVLVLTGALRALLRSSRWHLASFGRGGNHRSCSSTA